MRFAVTIGSFALPGFVELNVLQCKKVFPSDTPILISDDWSQESATIKALADRLGVYHIASETPRNHFCGDIAAVVNGLAFAQSMNADIMIKISQRFILVEPVCSQIISQYFASPEIWLALPGRISAHSITRPESRFFAQFPMNTDLIVIRSGSVSPEQIKSSYEEKVQSAGSPQFGIKSLAGYVESFFNDIAHTHFANHLALMPEFTHHAHGRSPLFLRRCQSHPADYFNLAQSHHISHPSFPCSEWRDLIPHYRPRPIFQ